MGTQEDASEFFTTLLESMAKSIRYCSDTNATTKTNGFHFNNTNGNGFMSNNNNNNNNKSKNATKATPATAPKTILDDIFAFQFTSRITCGHCGRLSDTIENTNTWPVDVKYVQDIKKGMMHFLRQEVLDGENAYKCDK